MTTSLITGANGFLGSSLVRALLTQTDDEVRCMVRPGSDRSKLDRVTASSKLRPFKVVTGNIESVAGAREVLEGVDVVYHSAAALSGQAADMCLNTVVASKNLLEAARTLGKWPRFVLVSSFSVYGASTLERGAVLDERTPLEAQPAKRDIYAQSKLRQEQLFWEYQKRYGFELSVLRPGVIYGPGGGALSSRVGLQLPGVFLRLGHGNLLPLSYVDNCADAIALAGRTDSAVGQAFNVHDDDLPTCAQYLREYERQVGPVRGISVPYPLLMLTSRVVEAYHERSQGQLPALFTPYKTATMWKGNRFDNTKLKSIGWQQAIPTSEAMRRTFEYFKSKRS